MRDYEDGYGEDGVDLCPHRQPRDECDICGRLQYDMDIAVRAQKLPRHRCVKCDQSPCGMIETPAGYVCGTCILAALEAAEILRDELGFPRFTGPNTPEAMEEHGDACQDHLLYLKRLQDDEVLMTAIKEELKTYTVASVGLADVFSTGGDIKYGLHEIDCLADGLFGRIKDAFVVA